jgi:polysaccharide biosynthesis/export protein
MKYIRPFLLLALPLYLFSCKPQQKIPFYLENASDTDAKQEVKIPELRIQKNDLLSIQISSLSTKPEVDMIYNQPSVGSGGQGTTGYLVDLYGNIEHHRLGTIHAEGLNKQQLAAEIKKRLTEPVEVLANPTVIIRFINFKVLVMGEVAQPGTIPVVGERITILEAIGLAGDITKFGLKNKVKVIREIDGKRETGIIDLSSNKLFESPYYNLLQNDLVLVEPSKTKSKTEDQAAIAQKVSFALTLATVAASIAGIFLRN